MSSKPPTYVYVDGFNLYYGCFKDSNRPHLAKYKWLDLQRFCDSLFPQNDVLKIKYYTADVYNRPPDNHQNDRQKAYLRALSCLPRVEIIKGYFSHPKPVRMPLCDEQGNYLGKTVTVLKTEEKGTDVNLAVDLLYDAVLDKFKCAIIVSNDSDLVSPIRIAASQYNKLIGVANPQNTRPNKELSDACKLHFRIRESLLSTCQLPESISIGTSMISRPAQWK